MELRDEVHLQPDRGHEDRSQDPLDELVDDVPGVLAEMVRVAQGDPDQEGPEDRVDADRLGGRRPDQARQHQEPEDTAGPRQVGLDPGHRPVGRPPPQRQGQRDEANGQGRGVGDRVPTGPATQDHREDQPGQQVVHRGRHENQHAEIGPEQVQVEQDLGNDRQGADGQGGPEEDGEQVGHPLERNPPPTRHEPGQETRR